MPQHLKKLEVFFFFLNLFANISETWLAKAMRLAVQVRRVIGSSLVQLKVGPQAPGETGNEASAAKHWKPPNVLGHGNAKRATSFLVPAGW